MKIEAPTGGINARDNIDNMPLTDALEMINMVPEAGYVRSRKGSVTYIDDMGGDRYSIHTLATLQADGTEYMLAAQYNDADNGVLWDVTTSTPASLKTGLANQMQFNFIQFAERLILCNGADTPQVWDGSSSTTDLVATLKDSDGVVVVGKTQDDLWGVTSHHGRAFYWCQNEQRFFYADVAGAYQGDLIEFDLSRVVKRGGTLVNILSQSMDTGSGLNDLAVFVFSTGECVVYEGNDPAGVNTWGLANRFNIGEPVNIRCTCEFGGDNLIVTSEGLVSIREVMQAGRIITAQETTTNKIVNKVVRAYRRSLNRGAGWDMHYSSSKGLIVINYKEGAGNFIQLVMNVNNGKWCEYHGLIAAHWADYKNDLYFGGGGSFPNVVKAETGTSDNGDYIPMECITAFSDLGIHDMKVVTRVTMMTNYLRNLTVNIMEDNARRPTYPTPNPDEPFPSIWDVGVWDRDTWDSSPEDAGIYTKPRSHHYPSSGKGYTLAIKLQLLSRAQEFVWYFSKYLIKGAKDK